MVFRLDVRFQRIRILLEKEDKREKSNSKQFCQTERFVKHSLWGLSCIFYSIWEDCLDNDLEALFLYVFFSYLHFWLPKYHSNQNLPTDEKILGFFGMSVIFTVVDFKFLRYLDR